MQIKNKFMALVAAVVVAVAGGVGTNAANAAGGTYPLDLFPMDKLNDQSALQNGAKLFVNYCLNCHSASAMRYNRLRDIGLTEEQIKANLLFATDKVGEQMRISMAAKDAKEWFGALPPDLSLETRARSSHAGTGSDWVYTYLRTYYRDNTRATGWNNAVFPNVGMPHVFWQMQGARSATQEDIKTVKDEAGKVTGYQKIVVKFDNAGNRTESTTKLDGMLHHEASKLTLGPAVGGQLDQARFDEQAADITAYMTYMADPSAKSRVRIGVWVMIFLGLFSLFAWRLNAAYWKSVK
jgi:ubiquinol-cytochrome c reductase cytochrome c1 subunit